jgi:RecB family exonuclease
MASGATRQFLWGKRPFLEAAVERWIELVRERELDPASCVIVAPGRRAVRRVEALIAERAPADWIPPRVITEGSLAQTLARERMPIASAWQRSLAWRAALQATPAAERAALWGGDLDALPVAALAKSCAKACEQLAGEARDAHEVALLAEKSNRLGDARRWHALAAVERRFLELLATSGVVDPARAAREVVRLGRLREDSQVFAFALVDPTRSQREVLVALGPRLTSFVFAAPEHGDGFDELGGLIPKFWAERDIAIDSDRWRVVDHPSDQARVTVEHLRALGSGASSAQISIGVPDSDVLPFLQRALLEAGCEPRWAGGTPLAQTRAARLITAVLAFIGEGRTEDFAALVRHPDFDAAIAAKCGTQPGATAALLDEYVGDHVPAVVDGVWLSRGDESHSNQRARGLRAAHAACTELLGPLARDEMRTSAGWADALAAFAAHIWPDVELDSDEREAWVHAHALEAIAGVLEEARCSDATELSAREALELIGERIEAESVPPPPSRADRPVIELFGWLELVLDGAEHLVLTGVNEGALPLPAGHDAWFFEAARIELGLAHEQRRVARDVWALSAILASRPSTLLISGRRSSTRDPRTPSRLIFRCADELIVERVRRMWPGLAPEVAPTATRPAHYTPPLGDEPAPTSMSVSAFRDYLQSPYMYYVRHVRKLKTFDDRVFELDGRAFGTLAHDVLQAFGTGALADSTDPDAIRDALHAQLDAFDAQRFGPRVRTAVKLQIEQLRPRLDRFARWQARQARDGWRIARVEFEAPPRELDGMRLTGRIDRIDRRASDGAWRVLDYKTGDAGGAPAKMHRKKDAWIDLQLPLYRFMTEGLFAGAPQLGYILLDKSEDEELLAPFAKYDDALHADALKAASQVIADVRALEFDGVGDRPPSEPVLAALCGFGLLERDPEEEEP